MRPPRRTTPGEVLVVDDDREVRESLAQTLAAHGFEVLLAGSGPQLVAILREHRPAVILLDVKLPWLDGLELCSALKRNPDYRDIPVCFISGRCDPEDVRAGFDCGAVAYFVKPLDTEALLRKVAELCGQGDGPPEKPSAATGDRSAR